MTKRAALRDGMTIAELRDTWTEAQFQNELLKLAKGLAWRSYHTHISFRSQRGWPDLALVRHGRLVLAELKDAKRPPTPDQEDWLLALQQVEAHANGAVEVYLWRPADWDSIEEVLTRE